MRRLILTMHLWLGLILMAPLVVVGAAGSVLVWRPALERMFYPERFDVSDGATAPISLHFSRAQTAFGPDAHIEFIRLPAFGQTAVTADARYPGDANLHRVWLDPPTARVVAQSELGQNPLQVLHDIHVRLLIPKIGGKIVGLFGLGLFISAISGLILWWPRGAKTLHGLRWRRGPTWVTNTHYRVGFWISAPLAFAAFSGLVLAFGDIAYFIADKRAAESAAQTALTGAGPVDIDGAIAAAQSLAVGGQPLRIQIPGDNSPWLVTLRAHESLASATFAVEPETGDAHLVSPARDIDAVFSLLSQIHAGGLGGFLWALIVTLSGLAPLALAVTGLMMWLRKRKKTAA